MSPQEVEDALDSSIDPFHRYNLPGPIDWTNASHWIEYDHEAFTVELWCKMGPDYRFRLRQRVRPMSEGEKILSVTREFSRDAVLEAYGITKTVSPSLPPNLNSLGGSAFYKDHDHEGWFECSSEQSQEDRRKDAFHFC